MRPSPAASSKLKGRLARKAELARNSRRRKKAKLQAMLDKIDGLQRLVDELKAANALGVRWKEPETSPHEAALLKEKANAAHVDAQDESVSDEEDEEEEEEVETEEVSISDDSASSPRSVNGCSLGCGAAAPAASRCAAIVAASAKCEKRKRPVSTLPLHQPHSAPIHCHSASTPSPTSVSNDACQSAKKRLRAEGAGRDTMPALEAEKGSALAVVSAPPTSVMKAPVLTALPLSQVWLECVDELQTLGRPLLSRSVVSLPLSTTFAALRSHLLALQFPSASPAFSFMVGGRVLETGQEVQSLAEAGVVQGAVLRLVRRSLMLALIGVPDARGGMAATGCAVKLGKAEEEAASTISQLAQQGVAA